MGDPVVDLRDGSRTLAGGQRVLDKTSLTVGSGESVAIVGRSGSGKSTLLAGLGLLAPFDAGSSYRLAGRDAGKLSEAQAASLRARSIGFILQNSGLVAHLSALENVRMPLLHARDMGIGDTRREARRMLEQLEISHLASRRPSQVSGGERQRVAIARALVSRPSLILADEPTGALDETTGHLVLDQLLTQVAQSDVALVIVTHDREVAARTDRVYRLNAGRLELEGQR